MKPKRAWITAFKADGNTEGQAQGSAGNSDPGTEGELCSTESFPDKGLIGPQAAASDGKRSDDAHRLLSRPVAQHSNQQGTDSQSSGEGITGPGAPDQPSQPLQPLIPPELQARLRKKVCVLQSASSVQDNEARGSQGSGSAAVCSQDKPCTNEHAESGQPTCICMRIWPRCMHICMSGTSTPGSPSASHMPGSDRFSLADPRRLVHARQPTSEDPASTTTTTTATTTHTMTTATRAKLMPTAAEPAVLTTRPRQPGTTTAQQNPSASQLRHSLWRQASGSPPLSSALLSLPAAVSQPMPAHAKTVAPSAAVVHAAGSSPQSSALFSSMHYTAVAGPLLRTKSQVTDSSALPVSAGMAGTPKPHFVPPNPMYQHPGVPGVMVQPCSPHGGVMLGHMQGELAVMYNWFATNRDAYLEQAKGFLAALDQGVQRQKVAVSSADIAAVSKAVQTAVQIVKASVEVESSLVALRSQQGQQMVGDGGQGLMKLG